jgi:hypothetical protein
MKVRMEKRLEGEDAIGGFLGVGQTGYCACEGLESGF